VTLRIALSVGERSGDELAGAIAEALRRRRPDIELIGVAGPRMRKAGVQPLADVDDLGVMGLFEVIRHVPRLYRLRRRLRQRILSAGVDAFVGVDSPDFNLGLARSLRRAGVATSQVVAPSVWAWRRYRIPKVARSLDRLLTLFPFETALFEDTGLDARFIGHPMADALVQAPDRSAARDALEIGQTETVVALLPGSRGGEIARHAPMLVDLGARLRARRNCRVALLLADEADRERFAAAAGRDPAASAMTVVCGRTRLGLVAADVAAAASGTVTLEGLLCRTPMVVFYRLPAASYRLARALKLVKSRYVSLPNVLADEALLPERIQHDATPARIAEDVEAWLEAPERMSAYRARAEAIHQQLAQGAAESAAWQILDLAEEATKPGIA
jgi:lipid-A-disaccharide synthase